MATVKISDGRTVLYQWDTGVIIELCDCRDFTECHFATDAGLIRREVTGSLCAVPDAALQRAGILTVYAFARDENGGQTQHVLKVNVLARPKPADYVDPSDESDYIDQIVERATAAIKHGVDGGYYTPAVDEESGELTWSASKEGMPAVSGANIKGAPGYTPVKGKDYVDGTSVTVENVTESAEDGGNNTVLFSDGKQLNVKNGSKGNPGYTPVKGVDYFDGKDGESVTVQSVTESTEDGGNNTVLFSNGKTLNVKNGSKGKDGDDGVFVVHAQNVDGVYHADKTPTEISVAVNNGRACVLLHGGIVYTYISREVQDDGQYHHTFAKPIELLTNGYYYIYYAYVLDDSTVKLKASMVRIQNPKSLQFKGAVTATYDGSAAVTVTIPEGGSGGGGSGENSILFVNFAEDDRGKWTADKAFTDVATEYITGRMVYGRTDAGLVLPMMGFADEMILFGGMALADGNDGVEPIICSITWPADGAVNVENAFVQDATRPLPSGGKAGQVLCKASDNDYDVEWADVPIPEQYGLVTYNQDKVITIT